MNYYEYTIKCINEIKNKGNIFERIIQIAYVKGLVRAGIINGNLSEELGEEINRLLNNLL